MKTFIVNLLDAIDRKKHMENILFRNKLLEPVFIEAVDGRIMSKESRESIFDNDKSFKEYGRALKNGEIGCTLSHYKIYKQMIDLKDKCAIIFEDDIEIISDINKDLLSILENHCNVDYPVVILLSGKYEFYKTKKINNNNKIATVFDAWGTYGYVINKKAAEIISNEKPFWIADDWRYFKSKGVKIFGIKPHIIEPLPIDIMPSYAQIGKEKKNSHIYSNMTILKSIKTYYRFGMKKIFKFIGLYEPEITFKR